MPLDPKTVQAMQEAWQGVACSRCSQPASRLDQGEMLCYGCWRGKHEVSHVELHRGTDPRPKHSRGRF